MPFGRHSGRDLRELPDQYLDWLATLELRPPLSDAVRRELERRRFGIEPPPRLVSFPCLTVKVPAGERDLAERLVSMGQRALARKRQADGEPAVIERLNALAETVREQLEVRP